MKLKNISGRKWRVAKDTIIEPKQEIEITKHNATLFQHLSEKYPESFVVIDDIKAPKIQLPKAETKIEVKQEPKESPKAPPQKQKE